MIQFLTIVNLSEEKIVEDIYKRVLKGETIESEIEVSFNDEIYYFMNRFKPVNDVNGNLTGIFCYIF